MEGAIQANTSSLNGALEYIEKSAPGSNPAADPALFVRTLGRSWKERGGTIGGKRRHSDRQLSELLKSQGTVVKSLTPKLAGKTKFKPSDVSALVRLFLSHWDYLGNSEDGDNSRFVAEGDLYRPMLSDDEIEEVCRYVEHRMSESNANHREEANLVMWPFVNGEDSRELIPARFQDSDAIFTISSKRTLITPEPTTALIGFRNLMNDLFTVDMRDDRTRMLVWILDLGTLDFEDYDARLRFLNVESLMSRFTALKVFKEAIAEARWNWLRSRVVIMLRDLHTFGQKFTGISALAAQHFLFSAIPSDWARSSEFHALCGNNFEHLDEQTYSVFLTRSADHCHFRYFAHGLFLPDDGGDRQLRGLELPSAGRDYEVAFETVYKAAACALGLDGVLNAFSIDDCKIAISELRGQGFSLLSLDAFVNFWSLFPATENISAASF
jgi:hypothetical protein